MVFNFLSILLVIILSLNAAYVLLFVFASLFSVKPKLKNVAYSNKFAVFIPAYKGDEVILSTALASLNQNYPKAYFDVIVIADSLLQNTLDQLKKLNVIVVEVNFDNSTKAKSINAAIDYLGNTEYDYAVVLDIDNIMEDDFLLKINNRLDNNITALQAHRVAKNEDTPFAILDAISEEVNNQIFRKGHSNVGLSAALIGSAMAIKYQYFKYVMKRINAIGGFDKDLEVNIISDNIKIAYAHDIYVYDEKVQQSSVFSNQRRRWLSAQFVFLKKFGVSAVVKSFKNKNFDLLDKIIQFTLIPRVILLGFLAILSFGYFVNYAFYIYYVNILKIYFLAILLAVPAKYYRWKYVKVMVYIPKAFAIMIFNLFKVKGANKKFIHTPHNLTPKDKFKK